MNKEESLSLAITVGAHIERNSCNSEMLTSFTEHELLTFANACEKIGMEKAADIADTGIDGEGCSLKYVGDSIREAI